LLIKLYKAIISTMLLDNLTLGDDEARVKFIDRDVF